MGYFFRERKTPSYNRFNVVIRGIISLTFQTTEEGYDGMYNPYFDEDNANMNPFMEGQLMDRVAKKQAPSYK